MSQRGLDGVQIPAGGRLWRGLGSRGALLAGYVLAGTHVVILGTVAVLLGRGPRPSGEARALVMAVQVSTVLLPLLAMCLLWIGELVRRGRWGGPSGHKPDAMLPQGSTTVAVRLVAVRWNVVWLAVSALAAGVLLWLALQDALHYALDGHLVTMLLLNGLIAGAATGATLGALVKKAAWLRRPRARRPAHPALARRRDTSPARTFWRAFSFRWRFDVWLCVLGAVVVWFALFELFLARGQGGDPTPAFVASVVGGVLLLAGAVATTQFWRSGEDLSFAESVA